MLLSFLIAIMVLYGLFLALVMIGLKKMKTPVPQVITNEVAVSVIVAARNESQNIANLLKDLSRQEYTNYEVIVVNDHSEDDTETIVHDFGSPLLKCIQNEGTGKKSAITTGVAVASGEIILTTDADCRLGTAWVATIANIFENGSVKFAFGGVVIEGEGTLFSHMQQLEYATLMASAAAAAAFQRPMMSSGANMAFRKEIFHQVGGYEGNAQVPSGDDEFLMRKIQARHPGSIAYVAHHGAMVKARAARTIRELFNQRLRWASKWKHNTSATAVLAAFFIVLVQIALMAAFVFAPVIPLIAFMIAGKFLADLLALSAFSRHFRFRFHLDAFVSLFFVYPFYVLAVGVMSNFTSYHWKARRY